MPSDIDYMSANALSQSRKLDNMHLAVLDVIPYDGEVDTYVITRINVPKDFRGRGIAREMMDACLKEADLRGLTLWLEIVPSGGLTYSQLARFYKRCGFVDQGGAWERVPPAEL